MFDINKYEILYDDDDKDEVNNNIPPVKIHMDIDPGEEKLYCDNTNKNFDRNIIDKCVDNNSNESCIYSVMLCVNGFILFSSIYVKI